MYSPDYLDYERAINFHALSEIGGAEAIPGPIVEIPARNLGANQSLLKHMNSVSPFYDSALPSPCPSKSMRVCRT